MRYATLLFTVLTFGFLPARAEDPPAPASPAVAYLYQPKNAVMADVIPFYWKDRFHLLHLRLAPGQAGFEWAQIITKDFVSYEDAGVAIPNSTAEDAIDRDIFTGSVIEKDGVLHAFYAGHNDAFAKQQKADQIILHARSSDGLRWTKDPAFRFSPENDARYVWPAACRDAFAFWNPERNDYGLLVTATPRNAPAGGLAFAHGADLEHWQLGDPLAASGRFPGYECPDLFHWGDRWYLLFSTYWQNPGWATRYMTAPALGGPWTSPADDFLDGASLYAAKSVSDGNRRFLCGTLPRRDANAQGEVNDEGDNGWSGRLIVHELIRRADGSLGARIPAEVAASFGEEKPVALPDHPGWPRQNDGVRTAGLPARAELGRLPARCLLSAEITIPPTGRVGLWIGGDAGGKEAFRLSIDAGTQRLVWDRNERRLGGNPEKERPYRPLRVQPGDKVSVQIALDGDAAVACANGDICLSTRIYNRRDNTFGLWADTTGAGFARVMLRAAP